MGNPASRSARQLGFVLASAMIPGLSQAAVTVLPTPDGGMQPQVVARGNQVHLIYFKGSPKAGDALYVRSTDGGRSFGTPIRVNSMPGSVIAMGTVRGAHLAVGKDGRAHVAWMGAGKDPRTGHHAMFHARLRDEKDAFTPQKNVMQFAHGLDGGGSVAADEKGNVYVTWHAGAGRKGESLRSVFVARSSDEGRTFRREFDADPAAVGACGCCGIRAFATAQGSVQILYRTARNGRQRDIRLLSASGGASRFRALPVDAWKIDRCVMSTAAMTEFGGRVYLAWETKEQIHFSAFSPKSARTGGKVAAPGSGRRKHPAIAVNRKRQVLLAWAEGTGWNRGGKLRWQLFDASGRPVGRSGGGQKIPVWGAPAAFARPDGGFVIVH